MSAQQQAPLSSAELSAFCSQMAMILRSGIPEREGLCIMRDDAADTATQQLMSRMAEQSESGFPLSQVLRSSDIFPRYMCDMVEVGECSGKLDTVLDALTEYYEREENIWSSVKNAITYPLIMLMLMILVIAVLSIKVLPIFSQVFAQLGAQVSVFAEGVLRLGSVMGKISTVLVVLLVLGAIAVMLMRMSEKGRKRLNSFFAVCPITKRVSAKIATGRFAGAMALMLSSGMDTDRSLEMAGKLVDHEAMAQRVQTCKKYIAEGASFSDAIAKSGVFSGMYARMILVGFRTGSVDKVFNKLANRCEQEIDDDLSRLVGVIEPSLVALLSVVVGLILLSVMLPLMGIMSSIG